MIEVGRNSIIVRNVDLESQAYKNVNYQYSLWDKVQHKYTLSAFTLIDNDLYFPSSIGLDQIQKHFPNKDVSYNYKTTSKSSQVVYTMNYGPRDDLQKDSINFSNENEK